MKKSSRFLFVLALGLSACQQKKDFKVNVSLANGNDNVVYLQKYVTLCHRQLLVDFFIGQASPIHY